MLKERRAQLPMGIKQNINRPGLFFLCPLISHSHLLNVHKGPSDFKGGRQQCTPYVPCRRPQTVLWELGQGWERAGDFNDTQSGQLPRSRKEMPYISDGLLRFLFSIPGVPAGIFHLALQLHEVCLQLLLGVDEASVLGGEAQVLLTR